MKVNFRVLFVSVLLMFCGCTEKGFGPDDGEDMKTGDDVGHEMIVLGDRLDDPYAVRNITKAIESLYPTKAGRVDVTPTDIYLRFLPKNEKEYGILEKSGLDLMDHPLDYRILRDGDYYHDPELDEDEITWQYAVVRKDFKIPSGIEYEILDECYIPGNGGATKAYDGIDWTAVEREAYRLTGNEELYLPPTRASSKPKGRLTIVDEEANGGKPFGVAGVRIVCNSFVKFASAYTDRDGYYELDRSFSSNVRYRILFKNEKKFAIGFNMILKPASASALGKTTPEGMDYTVTKDSDRKLFTRCVVNNAVYEYITRCAEDDMNISPPPEDLRIWMFQNFSGSTALMMRQGASQLEEIAEMVGEFYGNLVSVLRVFFPDIVLGVEDDLKYSDVYANACHELAHASHFMQAGKSFWDNYINYLLRSFISSGGLDYGSPGSSDYSGYCEVGEMWSFFMENEMYQDRYAGVSPTSGMSFWFRPQIFSYLSARGMSRSQIFKALTSDVSSRDGLMKKLTELYPEHKADVEQIFDRYPPQNIAESKL